MSYLTSPPFEYIIPDGLAVGGSFAKMFEYEVGTEGLYVPFNSLLIDNFSAEEIEITYGAGHFFRLRGNSMAEIVQPGIRGFTITNIGTNPTDKEIIVYVQKRITTDIALESIVRRIPIEKLMNG